VSATKGGVEGSKSSTVSQKTFPDGTVPAPGQVTGINTSVAGNSVSISWGAEGGATSYTLERGSGSSGPWTQVYKGSSLTYTDSGLAAGTYYYHAAASNASGMGPWSAARAAVISGGSGSGSGQGSDSGVNPPSGIPGYLTVVTTTKNSVTLSWDAVEGASGYKVYRSDTETGTYTETTAGTFSGTGFTDTGLSPGKDYWYKVAAYNAGGAGPKSITPVKATTLANTGTIPGEYTTLAQKLAYIAGQADDGVAYDIEVTQNEYLEPTIVATQGRNVVVNLHSADAGDIKTIQIMSTGTLLTVNNNITLKLQDITLKGRPGNNAVLIKVALGGTMIMNQNAKISDNRNTTSGGGGLYIDGGAVTMNDGEINGNIAGADSAGYGGGVYVKNGGAMVINGGKITGNAVAEKGFSSSYSFGGGIYIDDSKSKVTMHGGEISNNSASNRGGGICASYSGCFAKTSVSSDGKSGVIYGSSSGPGLANTATNGAAIYGPTQRNDTLGQFDEY
jgi:fibronectin type 3 domain-containing protein